MPASHVVRGRPSATVKDPLAEDVYTQATHASMDLERAGENASKWSPVSAVSIHLATLESILLFKMSISLSSSLTHLLEPKKICLQRHNAWRDMSNYWIR
jgi:hypothetical protein